MKKLLENILSFTKEKREKADGLISIYRKITFLGIKLNFKLYEYYNPAEQKTIPLWYQKFIRQSWEHLEHTQQGEYFERDMENLQFVLQGNTPKETMLVFISLFIENNACTKAIFNLNQYLQKYGEDGLHEWLLISNFMVENNLTQNPKILNASKIFKICEKAEQENEFANYLKGKTIAVVGNGPCELGKNRCEEIDSHDVVIRFNEYPYDEKFISDYGKKVSIRFIAPNPAGYKAFENIKKSGVYPEYILLGQYKRAIFPAEFVDELLELNQNHGVKIISNDSKFVAKLNMNFATAGFCVLPYVIQVAGRENVTAYGFNFLDNNPNKNEMDRSFQKRNALQNNSCHNFAKESEILSKVYFGNFEGGGSNS